jgi:hypothetical protein
MRKKVLETKHTSRYPEEILKLRKLARRVIPIILERSDVTSNIILSKIKVKYADLCLDEIICNCGNKKTYVPSLQRRFQHPWNTP